MAEYHVRSQLSLWAWLHAPTETQLAMSAGDWTRLRPVLSSSAPLFPAATTNRMSCSYPMRSSVLVHRFGSLVSSTQMSGPRLRLTMG